MTYQCGCNVLPIANPPKACPMHGRIAAPPSTPEVEAAYAPVYFTPAEIAAFGAWLERQTFPYDGPLVQSAARRVIEEATFITPRRGDKN